MNIRLSAAPKLWHIKMPTNMKRRTLSQRMRQWSKDKQRKRYIVAGQMPIW